MSRQHGKKLINTTTAGSFHMCTIITIIHCLNTIHFHFHPEWDPATTCYQNGYYVFQLSKQKLLRLQLLSLEQFYYSCREIRLLRSTRMSATVYARNFSFFRPEMNLRRIRENTFKRTKRKDNISALSTYKPHKDNNPAT